MASVVDIVNIAMHRLGLDDIASLTEGTQKARLAAACYDQKRQLLLEKGVWTFARKRIVLAPSTNPIAFNSDFQYSFTLPADYLRMVNTQQEELDYLIEGDQLLFNSNSIGLRYVRDITDPNLMSAGFREALGLSIAIEICITLTGNKELKQQIMGEYAREYGSAGTVDAQSNGEGEPPDDAWIMART